MSLSQRRNILIAAALVVVTILVVALAVGGGDDDPRVALDGDRVDLTSDDPPATAAPSVAPTVTPGETATATPVVDDGDSGGDAGGDSDSDSDGEAEQDVTERGIPMALGPDTCAIEFFALALPTGWYADDACARFSRAPVVEDATEVEVDLAWTWNEDFDASLARIRGSSDTWRILAEESGTVDGHPAVWLAVELGPDSPRPGRQQIHLIDLFGGTLFVAASSHAPDGVQPTDFGVNLNALETIVSTISIIEFRDCEMGIPPTVAPDSVVRVDLDGDGTTETITITEFIGTGAEWTFWRWSCDEAFVPMTTFQEQGSQQSPAWYRCRDNGDGTVDVVFHTDFLDDDETYSRLAEVFAKVGDDLVLVETYEGSDVEPSVGQDAPGIWDCS